MKLLFTLYLHVQSSSENVQYSKTTVMQPSVYRSDSSNTVCDKHHSSYMTNTIIISCIQ